MVVRHPRLGLAWLAVGLAVACGSNEAETASDAASSSGMAGAGGTGDGGASASSSESTGGSGGATCASPCALEAHCDGGACVCNAGFEGDGISCVDVDECKAASNSCHATGECKNETGGFSCSCPSGTVGDASAGGSGCEARYTTIVAGRFHTCARRVDGATYCFGTGSNGRLGNGASTHRHSPVQAGAASNWVSLAADEAHTCGIKTSGNLWCWGFNNKGQLGTGNTVQQTLPSYLSLDTKWLRVATGASHTCAVRDDGVLYCWGSNENGQLGIGTTESPKLEPVHVNVAANGMGAETDWVDVAAARDTTCARKNDGKLYCWGGNANKETSKPIGAEVPSPYLVETSPGAADSDWMAVDTGWSSCAIKTSGALFCWGRNAEGQLGNGTTTASASPVEVMTGTSFKLVQTGLAHTCALSNDGGLYCWGRNQASQIKEGAPGRILEPLLVDAATDWTALALGAFHTCGVDVDGKARCWGANGFGWTAQGSFGFSPLPVQVGASTSWTDVWAYGDSTCASDTSGQVSCFGGNEFGAFGLGDTVSVDEPTPLTGSLSQLAPGRNHACGIDTAGKLQCSGFGGFGNLGTGTTASVNQFGAVATTGEAWETYSWSTLTSSENASCAIAVNGELYCWGRNCTGQVDAAPNSMNSVTKLTKVEPAPSASWAAVAGGLNFHCGVQVTGRLWCWGANGSGQLGNGVAEEAQCTIKTAPYDHGTGWKAAVAAGATHTCAIKTDGQLWCWGSNGNGQLGDGTTTPRTTPVVVPSSTTWTQVAAGSSTTCGIDASGALFCWGLNSQGQLGLGDLGQRKLPALVFDKGVSRVAMGTAHTCAVKTDGTLWCWGTGELGQSGSGQAWAAHASPIVEAE